MIPWRSRWDGVLGACTLVGIALVLILFLAIGAGVRAFR